MKNSEVILYTTPQGKVKVEIRFEDETFWMTQKKLAELFDVEVHTINYHLKEIFKTGELKEEATIRNFRIVQTEGNRQVRRNIEFYNLDAIIAVGYRVNSYSATQFRIWATQVLREYMIKGFVQHLRSVKDGTRMTRIGRIITDQKISKNQLNLRHQRSKNKTRIIRIGGIVSDKRSAKIRGISGIGVP